MRNTFLPRPRWKVAVVLSALAMAAGAQPAAASTLVGESLVGAGDINGNCDFTSGNQEFTYTANGVAGPAHPGTFTETGSFELASPVGPVVDFEASFTIISGPDTIHGVKSPGPVPPLGGCTPVSARLSGDMRYDVISPFTETGRVPLLLDGPLGPSAGALLEEGPFRPPPAPSSKDDCKKGGHEDFGHKNQGQCIKSTKGK